MRLDEYGAREARQALRARRWLDVYQLAERFGLSVRTVWRIVEDAGLEPRYGEVPRRLYFNPADIERALKATPRQPRAKRVGR